MNHTQAPVISVVMSVHNAEKYLREAVDSILNQTWRDFEFIIIDDGSSDSSGEWLEDKVKTDFRIRLVRQENIGLTKSLNKAIAIARGELIARMDPDDISMPERFAKQVAYMQSHPNCVAFGTWVRIIDEDGDDIGLYTTPTSHEEIEAAHLSGLGGVLIHPTVLIRKAALARVGGYSEEFRRAQDFDLWLRLAEVGCLANFAEPLLYWRHHPNSAGYSASQEQFEVIKMVLRKVYLKRGFDPANIPEPPSFVRRRPVDRHIALAWHARQRGLMKASQKHARRAIADLRFFSDEWFDMLILVFTQRRHICYAAGLSKRLWNKVRRVLFWFQKLT